MGARSDFRTNLRSWVDRPDLLDPVVDDWITFAEERVNSELRHKDMINRVQIPFLELCNPLPWDWLEIEYLKYVQNVTNPDINIRSGRTLTFKPKHEYWDMVGRIVYVQQPGLPMYSNYYYTTQPIYTIIGNAIYVSPEPNPDGSTYFEISYYAKVAPLADVADPNNPNIGSDGSNWLYNNQRRLYTYAALAASAPRLQEDDRVAMWEQLASERIQKLNDQSDRATHSGSPLRPKLRVF